MSRFGSPAIPMAQRHTRHTRDAPDTNPHSLPLRSKKRPLQAYIHKSTDSLRLP